MNDSAASGRGGGDRPPTRKDVVDRRGFVKSSVLGLVGSAFGGCLDGPTGVGTGDGNPRLETRHAPPSTTIEPGETALTLGVPRDGLLYVPESYVPETSTPLLVALHGATGSADGWRGLYGACDSRGLLLLAVDSRGTTWDRVRGSFGPDVSFIDQALSWTFDRCNVDPGRVALIGFSDGASYVLSLGPCNGDLFPFLVAFSPGHSRPTDERVGDPRVWVSHGTADAILLASRTREVIVPELEDDGYDVTYVEFDGGHEVPSEIGTEALDWLAEA